MLGTMSSGVFLPVFQARAGQPASVQQRSSSVFQSVRRPIDPFTVQDGGWWDRGWAYGDPFVVYPGPSGPIDSMRWEVFGENVQGYRLLQTMGVPRDGRLLAPLWSFEDFPKTEAWRARVRKRVMEGKLSVGS